jgi:hypothetical protein
MTSYTLFEPVLSAERKVEYRRTDSQEENLNCVWIWRNLTSEVKLTLIQRRKKF